MGDRSRPREWCRRGPTTRNIWVSLAVRLLQPELASDRRTRGLSGRTRGGRAASTAGSGPRTPGRRIAVDSRKARPPDVVEACGPARSGDAGKCRRPDARRHGGPAHCETQRETAFAIQQCHADRAEAQRQPAVANTGHANATGDPRRGKGVPSQAMSARTRCRGAVRRDGDNRQHRSFANEGLISTGHGPSRQARSSSRLRQDVASMVPGRDERHFCPDLTAKDGEKGQLSGRGHPTRTSASPSACRADRPRTP